ncbi:hypothetical protein EVAR_43747_1 [Eumeta japonica]|uniref:Uncharacterized protein n=1 Tax=Eumeta variegata TaxID=151549 RepID=A0A4C1Y4N3_EUMVA|nr:hypothetical protein EVAR_43747_1 [Eumeta japonica]
MQLGDDCKAKWKSIRSAYIRSLNTKFKSGSAAGSKKEYYLAPYLLFLNPFTKNRPQEGNIPITQEDERHIVDSEHESHIEETLNNVPDLTSADEDSLRHEATTAKANSVPSPSVSSSQSSSFPAQTPQPPKYRKHTSEIDTCAIDYFTLKKKRN